MPDPWHGLSPAARRRAPWALVAGLFAVLVLLVAAPPSVRACTGCAPTFEELVSATHSIALVRWERREAGTDIFAAIDVLKGPPLRTVRLYTEYLDGRDPHGRWILIDEGYLAVLRVNAHGAVTDPMNQLDIDDTPRTLTGWYTAIRRMPDTSIPPLVVARPDATSVPVHWLLAPAVGMAIGWRRFGRRRKRARPGAPARHASPRPSRGGAQAIAIAVLLLGSCTGAPSTSMRVGATPGPTPTVGAGPVATPVPSPLTTAAGEVPCMSLTMGEHRAEAITARLADGRVLILGGYDYAEFWDDDAQLTPTWEMFDPSTDTFTSGGQIPNGVWPRLTTRLADGRVLVLTSGTPLLFDPGKGKFTSAGHPNRRQAYDIAVPLKDGRVLVTGGAGLDDSSFDRGAELFDPAARTWTVTGSMHTARFGAGAALLSDGRVLVAGGDMGVGEAELGIIHASAELYDPSTNRFVGARPMSAPRSYFTALALKDGRILITADPLSEAPVPSEVYSATTGRFTPTGSMPESSSGQAVRLTDGRVVVFEAASEDLSDPELDIYPVVPAPSQVYDPATGKFSELLLMNPFEGFTAAALRDGRVLLVGDANTALVCSP